MATYLFETTVTEATYNPIQNVAGKYGTGTGSAFVGAACPAGTLCVANGLMPNEGYEDFGINNRNTHYFNVATSGVVAGYTGDKTGIYASNTYNVNSIASETNGTRYNVGFDTQGLSIPAGAYGTFTMLYVGETYSFGDNNFTAVPTVGQYVTVSADGTWTPSATVPTTSGAVYGKVTISRPATAGTKNTGTAYELLIQRAAVATA